MTKATDLKWLEIMTECYFTQICVAVRKLCTAKGVPEMADDIIGEAFRLALERSKTYNPELADFDTWVIGHAKWYLAELFQAKDHELAGGTGTSGIHHTGLYLYAETPAFFSDEPIEDCGAMLSPSVPFQDPFGGEDAPPWISVFVASLTDDERRLAELLLLKCGERYPVSQMARDLGLTRRVAQCLLDSVRAKARQAINEQHATASS